MAIALDVGNNGGKADSGTSLTWSHTCSGSDLVLLVGFWGDVIVGNDDITSVTYNGVGMTFVAKTTTTTQQFAYLYILVAPDTGAHNVVISWTNSHQCEATSVSYTGCAQTGQPDNSATATGVGDHLDGTLTTVADNCWLTGFAGHSYNGLSQSPASGTTQRALEANYTYNGQYDNNAVITPAGSATIGITYTLTSASIILASLAPATAAAGQPTMRRWGGVPFVGGQGIGQKGYPGRAWGRLRSGIYVPSRYREAA